MEIKVSEVVIEIGTKKVSLTPDQARELRDALSQLLGAEKEIVKEREHNYPNPYPWRWWTVYPQWGTISNAETGSYTLTFSNTAQVE